MIDSYGSNNALNIFLLCMFENNEPFTYLHCWKLLKDEVKWSDRMVELNAAASKPPQAAAESGNVASNRSAPFALLPRRCKGIRSNSDLKNLRRYYIFPPTCAPREPRPHPTPTNDHAEVKLQWSRNKSRRIFNRGSKRKKFNRT